MVKIFIEEDEWYPMYFFGLGEGDRFSVIAELTQEEHDFIVEARKNFNKAQDILEKKFKGAEK